MIPCHARFVRALRLETWDRFVIPLPFSRLDVTLGQPERVPPGAEGAEFEAEERRMESVLRAEAD